MAFTGELKNHNKCLLISLEQGLEGADVRAQSWVRCTSPTSRWAERPCLRFAVLRAHTAFVKGQYMACLCPDGVYRK